MNGTNIVLTMPHVVSNEVILFTCPLLMYSIFLHHFSYIKCSFLISFDCRTYSKNSYFMYFLNDSIKRIGKGCNRVLKLDLVFFLSIFKYDFNHDLLFSFSFYKNWKMQVQSHWDNTIFDITNGWLVGFQDSFIFFDIFWDIFIVLMKEMFVLKWLHWIHSKSATSVQHCAKCISITQFKTDKCPM